MSTTPGAGSRTPGFAGRDNPSPLDAIFVLGAAITLLLFLLSVLDSTKFAQPPEFLKGMVKSVWAKLSFASGSAAALVLRKFIDSKPAPNYLIWIPSTLLILIAALFVLQKAMPQGQVYPSVHTAIPISVSMSLDEAMDDIKGLRTQYIPDFNLWEDSPEPAIVTHGVYFNPTTDPLFPYHDTLSVLEGQKSLAYIKLNPFVSHIKGSDKKYDYKICLNRNAAWTDPVLAIKVVLSCEKGACNPEKPPDSGFAVTCPADRTAAFQLEPVVQASEEPDQQRERGWDVPNLTTLQQMKDRERVGYTLFDVSFTPTGKAASSDSVYYSLRVNDQPVYIGGLSPGLEKERIQQGDTNHIQFGLENLNFTGQYNGYENLSMRIYFVSGTSVVFYQDLSRKYIALRNASKIPAVETNAGSFLWTGKYIVPKNENRYELLLASADCGDPPAANCLNRAERAKRSFDQKSLSFNNRPAVMVIRPPLRVPAAYGLALGETQPTGQVKFTYSADEAKAACDWAIAQIQSGSAKGFIRTDLRRYDVGKKGYAPCPTNHE